MLTTTAVFNSSSWGEQDGSSTVKRDLIFLLRRYEKTKNHIKLLNKEGFYIDDRQKRYLQMEKEMKEEKLKRLEAEKEKEKKDIEINLLRQEIQVLKLQSQIDAKDQAKFNLNQNSLQQLESISKTLNDWIQTNTTHDLKIE
ncbi:hypothetical protein K501DRAFT_265442 [Backusella circina FSU 941]|nr:hypothetical protein K501DRAFT_265442 [Backusella circina FSU 941]